MRPTVKCQSHFAIAIEIRTKAMPAWSENTPSSLAKIGDSSPIRTPASRLGMIMLVPVKKSEFMVDETAARDRRR